MIATDLRPTAVEVACGLVIDRGAASPRLPSKPHASPRDALDQAMLPALQRTPCLVTFSGGRDSSAVLAAATALARRAGLPLPVPVTYRFPGAAGAQEGEWQEDVVRHLGLSDWERLTITDELDVVGPHAQGVLRRHGPVWPFNAHFHVPAFERAKGGAVLTGVGGDEVFATQQWTAALNVLTGRRQRKPRHLLTVAFALAPRPVRQLVLARRADVTFPWLRDEVARDVNGQRAAFRAREPLRFAPALEWWWRSRSRAVLAATFTQLAADAATHLTQPFLDPSVVAAVAAHFGARGPVNRTAAMVELFGDVLPPAVLARRTKAYFDEAFFAGPSRAFVEEWDGSGVDPAIVDPERLRATWAAPSPDPRSLLQLQSVWAHRARGAPDALGGHGLP